MSSATNLAQLRTSYKWECHPTGYTPLTASHTPPFPRHSRFMQTMNLLRVPRMGGAIKRWIWGGFSHIAEPQLASTTRRPLQLLWSQRVPAQRQSVACMPAKLYLLQPFLISESPLVAYCSYTVHVDEHNVLLLLCSSTGWPLEERPSDLC